MKKRLCLKELAEFIATEAEYNKEYSVKYSGFNDFSARISLEKIRWADNIIVLFGGRTSEVVCYTKPYSEFLAEELLEEMEVNIPYKESYKKMLSETDTDKIILIAGSDKELASEIEKEEQEDCDDKYELLLDESCIVDEKRLYRIKLLKTMRNIGIKGALGGFIESYENLSQDGDSWVFEDAYVYDDAKIFGNAKIYAGSKICGDAKIFGNARIYESGITDNAKVFGNSIIQSSTVTGNVLENPFIIDSIIGKCALIKGNSHVEESIIQGELFNAKVKEVFVAEGIEVSTDITKNLKEQIRVQTGLVPIGDFIYPHKFIDKSEVDEYLFRIGETNYPFKETEKGIEEMDTNNVLGDTFFNLSKSSRTRITVKININDIIKIEFGEIYCTKYEIVDVYEV